MILGVNLCNGLHKIIKIKLKSNFFMKNKIILFIFYVVACF